MDTTLLYICLISAATIYRFLASVLLISARFKLVCTSKISSVTNVKWISKVIGAKYDEND